MLACFIQSLLQYLMQTKTGGIQTSNLLKVTAAVLYFQHVLNVIVWLSVILL